MSQEEELFKVEEESYRCEASRKIRSNIVEVSFMILLDLSCVIFIESTTIKDT